jgi:hypothetical protein
MHVTLASVKHQILQKLLLLLINFLKRICGTKNAIIAWLEKLVLSSLIVEHE